MKFGVIYFDKDGKKCFTFHPKYAEFAPPFKEYQRYCNRMKRKEKL